MNKPFSDEEFQEIIKSNLESLKNQTLEISKNKILIKYKNKLHNENGPAIERPNGDDEWYENGKFIKCSNKIRKIKRWFKEESSLGFDIGLALFAIAFIIFYVFYILSLK